MVFGAIPLDDKSFATDPEVQEGKWFERSEFLHLNSFQIVHPDMQLVYKVATDGNGLSVDTVKLINYDLR